MLHSLHVVWIHALCIVFSIPSCGEHEDVLQLFVYSHVDCSVPSEQCLLHHRRFLNITFGCNANTGKCTGISQCLVNSSKHSSGWYSMVQKTSLTFSYGINWITITKTVHIGLNHICILCNWKCKWHRERNRRTEMRIRSVLTGTLHCRFNRPRLYETIAILFWTSGASTVTVM